MSKIKYALIAVMLLVLIFALTAYADDNVAYYSVEGIYDNDSKTYTAEVYLNTAEYMSVGTFGIEYDEGITPTFILDTKNFEYERINFNYTNSNTYLIFQWGSQYDFGTSTVAATGKLHLGTLTVTNLEKDQYKAWKKQAFRQLKWSDTAMSQDPVFTEPEEVSGININREIWRATNDEEKTTLQATLDAAESAESLSGFYRALKEQGISAVMPDGYYQGYAAERSGTTDYDNWVDIGYIYSDSTVLEEPEVAIVGTVQGYNPTNVFSVTLYRKGAEDTPLQTVEVGTETNAYTTITGKGQVTGTYTIMIPEADIGDYVLKIAKDAHLTYTKEVTVSAGIEETDAGSVALYCGDIDKDERIKLSDRSIFMFYMDKQLYSDSSELAKRCDLNGDGKINIKDLTIFKLYYNKKYEEVV